MKISNVASYENQLKLKSLKGSLKFKKVLQIFTFPGTYRMATITIGVTWNLYSVLYNL